MRKVIESPKTATAVAACTSGVSGAVKLTGVLNSVLTTVGIAAGVILTLILMFVHMRKSNFDKRLVEAQLKKIEKEMEMLDHKS